MMKFLLTTGGEYKEGFKVSFSADSKEEKETIEKIMEQLISKISVIEIKVRENSEDNY